MGAEPIPTRRPTEREDRGWYSLTTRRKDRGVAPTFNQPGQSSEVKRWSTAMNSRAKRLTNGIHSPGEISVRRGHQRIAHWKTPHIQGPTPNAASDISLDPKRLCCTPHASAAKQRGFPTGAYSTRSSTHLKCKTCPLPVHGKYKARSAAH